MYLAEMEERKASISHQSRSTCRVYSFSCQEGEAAVILRPQWLSTGQAGLASQQRFACEQKQSNCISISTVRFVQLPPFLTWR